jgi:hypothetical protein
MRQAAARDAVDRDLTAYAASVSAKDLGIIVIACPTDDKPTVRQRCHGGPAARADNFSGL